jgi:transcriptional regulator of arginine metabolism
VVLRTGPGQAPPLAEALDRSGLPEIVGTLAGENTVFVVTPDARRARALARRLEGLAGGGRQ